MSMRDAPHDAQTSLLSNRPGFTRKPLPEPALYHVQHNFSRFDGTSRRRAKFASEPACGVDDEAKAKRPRGDLCRGCP